MEPFWAGLQHTKRSQTDTEARLFCPVIVEVSAVVCSKNRKHLPRSKYVNIRTFENVSQHSVIASHQSPYTAFVN